MRTCISEACTLSSSFEEDVLGYSEGGCRAIEVWLTKLEQHLESHSAADTKKLLEDRQITLTAGSYQGGLMLSQGEQRRAHFDHFKRRLDLCQGLGIPTLIVAPDFVEKVDQVSLERAVVSLTEAARWAAAFNVRLALEPRGKATFCACIDSALALARSTGEPNVGICLDVFHYYTGPSKFEDLALLDRASLAHVQVSDIAGVPRELATDADRIFPGEGDFQLGPIVEQLRAIGYEGWVSLEMLNPTLWQVKPAHLAELGQGALGRLLGEAPDRAGARAGATL